MELLQDGVIAALAAIGAAVTVCVATELGAEEQGCADGITVRTGRLDAEGMTALLRGAALCVDATHPYAAEATRNIRAAAAPVLLVDCGLTDEGRRAAALLSDMNTKLLTPQELAAYYTEENTAEQGR